ncbi:MAG: 5-(carboxyamino)imidazole ribonucleotide synthase, partial [Sphingopyxis sp.]
MPLPPGSTIGIVGGGQLGRMLAVAAAQIGYRTHVFAPEADAVAIAVANAHTTAAYDDMMALNGFANSVDVVTFEFENVPIETMQHLAEHCPVRPDVLALSVAQDRVSEKVFAAKCGIPVAQYAEVRSAADLVDAVASIGCPAIIKTVRDGYDGKGQASIDTPDMADAAWQAIGAGRAVVEEKINFTEEFSVILVRSLDGQITLWDCPANAHVDGILASSAVPVEKATAAQMSDAIAHSSQLAEALDYVGVLACEFFACANGRPVLNEFAPRVHNSGHWTIEGSVTSQFENHIRAICGLPIGATARTGDRVMMRNIIGGQANDWLDYLSDPQCHLHLYGKGDGRAGRKMGHATWVSAGVSAG